MYYSRFPKIVVCLLILLSLSACASRPHNNVLVFATDTKIALDISSEPTQGNFPEVTIGYKRREGVYMPLARNIYQCSDNDSSEKKNCTTLSTEEKYTGHSGDGKVDTYSVFASVGADFSAGSESSGGLAQFFITGIAAQNFAKNDDAQKALSLRSGEAEIAIAEKEALIAKKNLKSLQKELMNVLGDEYKKRTEESEQAKTTRERNINEILLCADLSNPKGKWKSILDHTQKDDSLSPVTKRWVIRLNNIKENKYWKKKLHTRDEVIKSMSIAVKKLCP